MVTIDKPPTLAGAGLKRGFRGLTPIALFVVPFGIAFGAAAIDRGLSAAQAIVMSATVFAAASQFAALNLFEPAMPYLSVALVVLALNARHSVLSAALSPWVNRLPAVKRISALCMVSDANFAASRERLGSGDTDLGHLVGGGMALWLAWVAGTAIGAFAGSGLGPLDRFGIDVTMVCFFATTVARDAVTPALRLPIVAAACIAVMTTGLLPTGWNIIAAALAAGGVGLARPDD